MHRIRDEMSRSGWKQRLVAAGIEAQREALARVQQESARAIVAPGAGARLSDDAIRHRHELDDIREALQHIEALERFEDRWNHLRPVTRALRPFKEQYRRRLETSAALVSRLRRSRGKPPDVLNPIIQVAAAAVRDGQPLTVVAQFVVQELAPSIPSWKPTRGALARVRARIKGASAKRNKIRVTARS
jgi:hypothetical protein